MSRAARTAVYLVADPRSVPQALLHNLKHNQVLHECNVILTVRFLEQPVVDDAARAAGMPVLQILEPSARNTAPAKSQSLRGLEKLPPWASK